jgi:hypothetical protein
VPNNVRYASNSDLILRRSEMTRWADTVEKGENELIKIFAYTLVETGFS